MTPLREEHLLEADDACLTTGYIFCPIGKGTRGLIVAPPRTAKPPSFTTSHTAWLKTIRRHLVPLLVDERPEEVTDFKRSVDAEIYKPSNDEDLPTTCAWPSSLSNAPNVLWKPARTWSFSSTPSPVSRGATTVPPARAVVRRRRSRRPCPRKTTSAFLRPKLRRRRHLIVATALIETGSKMDDLIFR